ncbi:MAG: hypothetical protein L3J49_14080 [Desulfobulbaceae bacterium]|nr:hypothetical protein [Desulfobulbaceae bacterium]
MNILGISTYSPDGAACLIQDGAVLAKAREGRFPGDKTEQSLPGQSIVYCLEQAGIGVEELDCIAFDIKPLRAVERILKTSLAFVPIGLGSFLREMSPWLRKNLWLKRHIVQQTGFQGKIIFSEHHEARAAAVFFPSPFQEAAFLTLDGVGEWATTSYGLGTESGITVLAEMRFPHSLELLYTAFAQYLGCTVNAGEDTLLEMASSGEPKYKKLILSRLMDLKADGSFRLNMACFEYRTGLLKPNVGFNELFGRPPRAAESPVTGTDMDVACSIQAVIEEIVLRMVEHVYNQTEQKKLCLSGWVFRNCVDGGRILGESSFAELWVQPEAGGAGAALGAALVARHQYLGNTETVAVTA